MRIESELESPTLRSPPFALLPITPLSEFDIEDSLLSAGMGDDDNSEPRNTDSQPSQPSDTEEAFFDLKPPTPSHQ
ncbi:hypothetical protein G7Y89_g7795 [Cudoniella acicularis]|uniref:Uncharacterized protein n=1 Tax=Cudoniella acicularis TaxID=354080 RepID=A0A8H4RJE1_9HELO|nr:hypothetical protein G7Y89_g7795 [Cudoniella acicularis]